MKKEEGRGILGGGARGSGRGEEMREEGRKRGKEAERKRKGKEQICWSLCFLKFGCFSSFLAPKFVCVFTSVD